MQHKPYNGWYNYETWAVKLWLDNDHGAYLYMREQAAETLERNTDDGEIDADGFKSEFADWLQGYHADQAEEITEARGASVFSDLISAALSEVNWYELAEAYLEEAKDAASA